MESHQEGLPTVARPGRMSMAVVAGPRGRRRCRRRRRGARRRCSLHRRGPVTGAAAVKGSHHGGGGSMHSNRFLGGPAVV
jgi:hypothetical protein